MIIEFPFEVGEKVIDSLTGNECTLIGITWEQGKRKKTDLRSAAGCVGYWVDNDYLEGGRHPWEISKLKGNAYGN